MIFSWRWRCLIDFKIACTFPIVWEALHGFRILPKWANASCGITNSITRCTSKYIELLKLPLWKVLFRASKYPLKQERDKHIFEINEVQRDHMRPKQQCFHPRWVTHDHGIFVKTQKASKGFLPIYYQPWTTPPRTKSKFIVTKSQLLKICKNSKMHTPDNLSIIGKSYLARKFDEISHGTNMSERNNMIFNLRMEVRDHTRLKSDPKRPFNWRFRGPIIIGRETGL